MHREASLYGDDPEVWRPERWMCGEEKKTAMYNALLTVSSVITSHDTPSEFQLSYALGSLLNFLSLALVTEAA